MIAIENRKDRLTIVPGNTTVAGCKRVRRQVLEHFHLYCDVVTSAMCGHSLMECPRWEYFATLHLR